MVIKQISAPEGSCRNTQLVVDTTLAHSTLLCEDAYEFHLEGSWGVRKTRAWFVTVQHLFLGVKTLESWQCPQKWDICGRQVAVDVPWLCPGELCKLLVGNSLDCLLYTSPSPRDVEESRMPSSA